MSTDITPVKIKKTRLTQGKRDVIRDYCHKAFTALIRKELKMDKTDAAMKAYVLKRIEEEFPAADMKVLAKYDQTRECNCIRITKDHDRYNYTEFDVGQTFSSPRNTYCHTINVTGKVADTWFENNKEFDRRFYEKRKQYNGLINAAVYFEDVVEVLPIVESIRGEICSVSTAVAVINPEIRAILQADAKAIAKLDMAPVSEVSHD